ncbi:MAG: RNA methyltransferase [Firmicutes bacterium]|jgi:TrmH family RNA methyltransferase|nr:RNA methyltransferase [Bacillota bacterium]
MRTITSRQNPLIKSIKSLRDNNRLRREKGLFLFEGVRLLEDALNADIRIQTALFCRDLMSGERGQEVVKQLEASPAEIVAVTPEVLQTVAETESPQGIVAVAYCPEEKEVPTVLKEAKLLVLLAGIQDPGNAGTLVRTAEAAGAEGILFTQGTVYPYSGKVIRASMGSLFRLPVLTLAENGEGVLSLARDLGWEVVVTTPIGGVPFWRLDLTVRTLLVLGNEGAGIDDKLLHLGTKRAYIPLEGAVESLNVSVAGGIILYEAHRQRYFKL